jgi:hypothetical protein
MEFVDALGVDCMGLAYSSSQPENHGQDAMRSFVPIRVIGLKFHSSQRWCGDIPAGRAETNKGFYHYSLVFLAAAARPTPMLDSIRWSTNFRPTAFSARF